MSEKLEYLPALFFDLCSNVAARASERDQGTADVPMAQLVGDLLEEYLNGGWARVSTWRQKAIDQLPSRERQVAQAAADMILLRLRQISPVGATNPDVIRAFSQNLCNVAQVAGEWLVGMQLVGESEQSIEFVRVMLNEILHDALVAGTTYQVAVAKKVQPRDIAPAVLAAVIARAQSPLGLSDVDAAIRFNLDEGMTMTSDEFTAVASTIQSALHSADVHITEVLRTYRNMAKEAFRPLPENEPWWLEDDPIRPYYPKAPKPPRPRIHMGPLLAFGASAGGGSEDARVRGAFDLIHSLSTRYLEKNEATAHTGSRYNAFNESVHALKRLEKVIASERATHGDVEARWREIETEMQYRRKQNPKEAVVYPFPDEFTALECRALYYQEALSRGAPLGVILAELYNSPKMTFGPSERTFFERVAFYSARKYAANFAAQMDPRLNGDRQELRLEDVRTVLTQIEIEIRKHEHLSDEELLELGDRKMREAVDAGELRMDEYRYLTGQTSESPWRVNEGRTINRSSIIIDMVLRARANQEVRDLTARLAIDGRITPATLNQYSTLPHTRSRALLDPPEMHLSTIRARNGQTLAELDRDSRARWLRYRQQMPEGVDVSPIVIPGIPETDMDNPMRLKSRRHFRPRKIDPRLHLDEVARDIEMDDHRGRAR